MQAHGVDSTLTYLLSVPVLGKTKRPSGRSQGVFTTLVTHTHTHTKECGSLHVKPNRPSRNLPGGGAEGPDGREILKMADSV